MNRAYLLPGIGVAAALLVVLLRTTEHPHPAPDSPDEETVAVTPVEQVGAASSPVVLSTSSEARMLEPVVYIPENDPCASVVAQLSVATARETESQLVIAALQREVARLTLERDRLRFDAATPYGAFLRSDEAAKITDVHVLVAIEDWLRQFPVFLGPGEATWIAERTLANDWTVFGRTSEVALIQFLGARRLAAELPPARAAELRAYYVDEPGVFP